ncbi:MAG: hypothetical protein M1829_006638 [Trizodia sp. TS-e1964]|nr:MAG: hypothetical protein M1829_006638 [Trizodia sp. TS-e1964]
MMNVQRRFGKFLPRSADEAQVSVVLKDYDDANEMLAKIISATTAWRDAWLSILANQYMLVSEFEGIYKPIIGASEDDDVRTGVPTPLETKERTKKLRDVYDDLRRDLSQELALCDMMILKPATDAKESIHPMKKVIKKREDRKLDFERYKGRVETSKKKAARSDRENASLAKAERDLARATDEYNAADAHLRETLPGVILAAYALIPHLLSAQIMIQNDILAQYYTVVQTYCQEENFPTTSPLMEDVISSWDTSFKPLQRELESGLDCLSRGKAVRHTMRIEDAGSSNPRGMAPRPPSSQHSNQRLAIAPAPSPQPSPSPEAPRLSNLSSPGTATPTAESGLRPPRPDYFTPPPIQRIGTAPGLLLPQADAFHPQPVQRVASPSSLSLAIASKKKPPPPPPPKRTGTGLSYVTALYSFSGQGAGDLAFKEGDRIRVTKKTPSLDDWWEGELRGTRGAFPANYCQTD